MSALKINSAFMNDFDIVAVRVEHPCSIIAGIVFGPSPIREACDRDPAMGYD
jgi:hypothetical protein